MDTMRSAARRSGTGPSREHPYLPGAMNDFRRLRVWQSAHQLALSVYQETSTFPPAERYGLAGQLRRAAVSVPANIAESCGRRSHRDEAHLLQVAFGSACELEAELQLSRDLGFLTQGSFEALCASLGDVKRMLGRLALRTYSQPPWHADG